MNVLVLSFDQLPLSWLGCYGNAEWPTPNFDAVANRSVVYDQHYVNSVDFEQSSHVWWTEQERLFELIQQQGGNINLLAEGDKDEQLIPVPEALWDFIGSDSDGLAENSSFSRLIDRTLELLAVDENDKGKLLWLKGLGLASKELPPVAELAFVAEEQVGEPTEEMLAEWCAVMSDDELFVQLEPDQQQDLQTIFDAARLLHLDQQLGRLWEAFSRLENLEQWLFIVTAGSGERSEHLQTLQVKTPFLLYKADQESACRRDMLIQSADLPATILDWMKLSLENTSGSSLLPTWEQPDLVLHEQIQCQGLHGQKALCTREHFLIETDNEQAPPEYQLYALPSDPKNKLDLATHDFEIVEQLKGIWGENESANT